MQHKKQDIREISNDELKTFLTEHGEKPFRAKQIDEWLWQKHARKFEDMTNLSLKTRQLLSESFELKYLAPRYEQLSDDDTLKVAFQTHDQKMVEGVLIPSGKRVTACLSSQIGCNLNCTFCATGKMGLIRNLKHWEIYDQLAELQMLSQQQFGNNISNVVFMGMGEPLQNYQEVKAAILRMTSDKGMGMAPRRITVSTAGLVKQIYKLADELPRVQLAISMHSADQEKRTELMPVNKANTLGKLAEALKYYHQKTGNRITFEYILFHDVNDQEGDAWQLARYCRQFPSKINLIEYNPVDGLPFEKASEAATRKFKEFLEARNMIVNVRMSRGKDIDAACGQLANKLKTGVRNVHKSANK